MQAMHIHLSKNQDILLDRGATVQGMNYPSESENPFDSFLRKHLNEDTLRAKEGPPEYRGADSSNSVKPNGEQGSNSVNENTQSDSQNTKKTDSTHEEKASDESSSKISDEKERLSDTDESEKTSSVKNDEEKAKALLQESTDKLRDTTNAELGLIIQDANVDQSDFQVVDVSEENAALKKTQALGSGKKVLQDIPTISVVDERSITGEGKVEGNFVHSISYDGNGNATLDMSLQQNLTGIQNPTGTIINADGSVQQHTVSNAQHFGTMLSSELQSNSSELVKTGSIILRDGNQGSINLILHPEELGNVKIRLEISDNVLTGRITVASEEAYNAFKENLGSLKEAFDANGFDTAGFDLAWSGEDQAGDQEQDGGNKNPFGNRYDENITVLSDVELQTYTQQAYVNVMV